ncbi:ABC transporter ATP-binding protein [Streptosporangium sp. NPDC002607]
MTTARTTLECHGISVNFGGVKALDDVSIDACASRVTALIGPNGAGKSTTLAVASGLLRPNSGRVLMEGADLTGQPPQAFARKGMARTFQSPQLVKELTVRQHIVLAHRAADHRSRFWRDVLGLGRTDRAGETERADELLGELGLDAMADATPDALPMGTRRLVEVAQCLANEPRLLLLDEPSAGLNATETGVFADLVKRLCRERSIAVLLVEHDLELVLSISDKIFVLDFGKLIESGTPDEIKNSEAVQAAYLGTVQA